MREGWYDAAQYKSDRYAGLTKNQTVFFMAVPRAPCRQRMPAISVFAISSCYGAAMEPPWQRVTVEHIGGEPLELWVKG